MTPEVHHIKGKNGQVLTFSFVYRWVSYERARG